MKNKMTFKPRHSPSVFCIEGAQNEFSPNDSQSVSGLELWFPLNHGIDLCQSKSAGPGRRVDIHILNSPTQ